MLERYPYCKTEFQENDDIVVSGLFGNYIIMEKYGGEMDDFEIEISEVNNEAGTSMQLPLNFLTIGEIENDDVKVYIKQDVYKELEKYAFSDTAHELGTIILGDYSEEIGKMHVIITDFIYAKYTTTSASTLTFTHETWDYIHKEHDINYPDKKIVGWQHTHPGYGIFLSNYDMFIQENFFNIPFQVAYVIDPVQHLRGFFQWKNGKVEKLKGFFIYDDLGKQIKIDQPKPKKLNGNSDSVAEPAAVNKYQSIVIGSLSLLTICLLISVFSLSKKSSFQSKHQETLESQIEDLNILIVQQAQEIVSIKDLMMQKASQVTEESDNTGIVLDKTEEATETENQQGTETVIPNEYEKETIENQVTFKAYTVQEGDSLLAICRANGLDYSATYRIILSMNGIDDANQIYVGQTILLPISK